MAIDAVTALLANVRQYAQDDNTAGNALTDAQWLVIVNEVMQAMASAYPEHFVIRAESLSVAFTSGVGSWIGVGTFNVRRVLGIRIGAVPLERIEPHRFYESVNNSAVVGTPIKYALLHDNSSATMTTKPNTYTVLLYPVPTSPQILLVDYEFYPIDIASATDLPRGLGDADVKWLELLSAARGAWLNGKDAAFIQGIVASVPAEMQSRMNVKLGLLTPRVRPAETPI